MVKIDPFGSLVGYRVRFHF